MTLLYFLYSSYHYLKFSYLYTFFFFDSPLALLSVLIYHEFTLTLSPVHGISFNKYC